MKKKAKRALEFLFGTLGVLLVAAVFVVLAVMAEKPAADKQVEAFAVTDEEPLLNIPATDTDDVSALSHVFGEKLAVFPDAAVRGAVRNASYQGATARVATLAYENAVVTCVRPAAAAPLLLRDDLDVSVRTDLSILSMPAAYAEHGNARCLYFSGDGAAYSLYAPDLSQEDFFTLAAALRLK
jgi:hypothetical protein